MTKRLTYIDWMRGLACVVMFQTHCYDSWLNPESRQTTFFEWSRFGGTLPAPLFIFLAGISIALVTEKLRQKGMARNEIGRQTILRGAEVFALGILFRIQEFALGYPRSPWTDLLRVDVLNILGISMILMGVVCWLTGVGSPAAARNRTLAAAILAAAIVALATPGLWTVWRPKFLPWPLESYVNGVHIFDLPQPWLFPLFPWVAFAFAGLTAGFWMFTDLARKLAAWSFALLGAAGVAICALSLLLDRVPLFWFGTYDYWHTSPNFFLMRCGILLAILALAYTWCRWGLARLVFSPLAQLGQTSLLVYWVHIEFVYGRFSILPKGRCSIAKATVGLIVIFAAMLGLSLLRTRWKGRKARVPTSAQFEGSLAT
ncbi:MAG TPA: heparan-alpha-glucosaminide N-acetyltransferase domain-containing protein [Candidatus Acidoferrum sp.]|nr:heparan-alpha-glucosaminide N-acetyltransferase domain-containing protein [Candidatus Acidoferrum sp.]